jgi:hypothetical protein
VKRQDASALILGPSDFTLGGWIGNPNEQDGLFAGQYYLQQMQALAATSGKRVLDYFDEHYYFPFTDPISQLESTRSLWDPTFNAGTWVEKYYFDGPMMLLPRFRQWIAQYYPATKLAISEYSIDSGNKLITDALAEADVLGIFGWQGLDFAAMWSPPQPTDPIAFSFLLFRDYDGHGHGFGTTSVGASSAEQSTVSVYAAQGGRVLTMILINKTANALIIPVSIANPAPTGKARFFSYSGADLSAIHTLSPVKFAAGTGAVPLPAWSMNVLEIRL